MLGRAVFVSREGFGGFLGQTALTFELENGRSDFYGFTSDAGDDSPTVMGAGRIVGRKIGSEIIQLLDILVNELFVSIWEIQTN